MVRPRGILSVRDMRLTTVTKKPGLIVWEVSRLVFHRSLAVVGKYETGLLPSDSGAAGQIGGEEMFRAR